VIAVMVHMEPYRSSTSLVDEPVLTLPPV
jgi:hypothetical protein